VGWQRTVRTKQRYGDRSPVSYPLRSGRKPGTRARLVETAQRSECRQRPSVYTRHGRNVRSWMPVILSYPCREQHAPRQGTPLCHAERVNSSNRVAMSVQRSISSWEFLGSGSAPNLARRRASSEESFTAFRTGSLAVTRPPSLHSGHASLDFRRNALHGANPLRACPDAPSEYIEG